MPRTRSILVLVLTALLTWCCRPASQPASQPAGRPVGRSSAAAAASVKPIKITPIGDSYAAGNGAGDYAAHPHGCYRSSSNWGSRSTRRLPGSG